MKLVFFTRHQQLGASSRYRSVQYFDLLRARGHEITQHYFFSDAYLLARYSGQRPVGEVMSCYVSRLRAALTVAKDADAVIIEKELFPYLPAFSEKLLICGSAAVIYDYDDAIWHAYERRRFGPFGSLFSNKIRKVVAYADHVVAGSHYLDETIRTWRANAVTLIPTTVPATRYQGQGLVAEKTTDIVWIGSMSTGTHVQRIFSVLERLHREKGRKTRLIGFPRNLIDGPVPEFVELVPWSAETELEMMASARVGIMPLPDELFERGKCGFKLVQYMGVGLPTVASPVGENRHIVRNGTTGYLADSADQWYQRLSALLDNPELANRMARAGHALYNTTYSAENAAQQLNDVIVKAVEARRVR
ncbi:MAG: hypothetical protein B7Y91_00520 [Rhodobacterales bacterium 32-64-14]|nr:MAG: hypothetical protein B7Y91_00520 [Rhodobacterales bacterium 32-64-14]